MLKNDYKLVHSNPTERNIMVTSRKLLVFHLGEICKIYRRSVRMRKNNF